MRLIIFNCLFLVITFFTPPLFAKHLGIVGKTWQVAEPDTLAEIREAAEQVDWGKIMDREKTLDRVRNYRPDSLQSLPAADVDRTFLVSMSYTLELDIPDGKGGILYPRGFAFNPLDYVNFSSILVVVNAEDQKQIDWFKSSPFAEDYRTRLLLSGGEYYGLSQELKRPIFYLMENVAQRLRLATVPAVIRQKGNMLEVKEFFLGDE